jgi:hypothetical protein
MNELDDKLVTETNTNNLKKETTEDFLKALDELNGEDR